MIAKGWHILRDDRSLTLTRQMPVRFDLSVVAAFPLVRKGRLAQQIRQDMWRCLQNLRGFVPAVRVWEEDAHLLVRAGGAIHARTFPKSRAEARLAALLGSPMHRARWLTNAAPVGV